MKSWLQDNNIETYSTNKERKSVVMERFIRNLKNKIYEHMTSISKNVYIDKLANLVEKYNNAYNSTMKMNPVDVKFSSTYTEFDKENSAKDPKFKVGDHVRISKYKSIFAKGYVPNWSQEVFMIKKVKKYCAVDISY